MPRYKVSRSRAYWVKETMYLDAKDEDEAEDIFFNRFDPTLTVEERVRFRGISTETAIRIEEG